MFIAHLPAGYLLTKAIQHKTRNHSRYLMWAGLTASIFPDIDLFYFYLIDNRQTLHHHYITHLPLAWMAMALIAWGILHCMGKKNYLIFVGVAFANLMLHMVLDSIAAGIDWLYPLVDIEINLVEVPARYDWWVWNFFLHWTFSLEILIIIAALIVWKRACKKTS
ncbi:MAG: metal-dependent hydrolase [Rickettsiales bacterium]